MNKQTIRPNTDAVALPKRSRLTIVIPLLVVIATAALVAWTAWPTLKPVRQVEVTQAVFDRASMPDIAPIDNSSTNSTGPATAAPQRVGQTVQAPGWLEAEPFYIAVSALANGVLETVEVLEGDQVRQGQILARLVDDDSKLRLRQAQATLATMQSELTSAQATLTAAQQNWDEPVALQRAVETTEAAVAEARAELTQLPSLIDEAKAESRRFDEELQLIRRSHEAQAASETELIVARQRADAAKARVTALQARQPLLEAKLKRFQAENKAAERDLKLRITDRRMLDEAKAAVAQATANVELAQARRDEAQLELDRMVIKSPIHGIVQERLKVPGDKVQIVSDDRMSNHVIHLYDPDRLQVRVDVPLADAANIHVGQRCEVVVEVLPDQTFQGQVLRITHLADLQKNTLEVKVKVIDPSPLLRPDMLTRVKFLPRNRSDMPESSSGNSGHDTNTHTTVLVPDDVLVRDGDSTAVWVVANRLGDRGVARRVRVTPMSRENNWHRVRGDLHPGALLILNPTDLREDEPVRFHGSESPAAQTAMISLKGAAS